MELTDKPRRLKPISIYYHTYAASRLATAQAQGAAGLGTGWAPHPVYASDHIQRVLEFQRTGHRAAAALSAGGSVGAIACAGIALSMRHQVLSRPAQQPQRESATGAQRQRPVPTSGW